MPIEVQEDTPGIGDEGADAHSWDVRWGRCGFESFLRVAKGDGPPKGPMGKGFSMK